MATAIDQATARRRLENLEGRLGLSLFTRTPGGLTPTPSARGLIQHVEAMAMAAQAFNRMASALQSRIQELEANLPKVQHLYQQAAKG